MKRFALVFFLLLPGYVCVAQRLQLGSHQAKYAADGSLVPWISWSDALDREMAWYLKCPDDHGYPRFVSTTFMDGKYEPLPNRPDCIPSMQNGMGIVSYLKYYRYKHGSDQRFLEVARSMGDYLVREALTPDAGKYPRFTRSTGWRHEFPQAPNSGSQDDRPFEIQPDKGGIAGYALVLLYAETKNKPYLDQALQNARVLVSNMGRGDNTHSPWPFRADYRTGEARGDLSGNMTYILRLFDKLIATGYSEFQKPRDALWAWIRDYQIPSASKDGMLWVEFFEDHHSQKNRTAWAPLNLARYLIEEKQKIDSDWQSHAKLLIDFVSKTFTSIRYGVAVCGEQDEDRDPWGGINSTYGAVLAMYSAATGSPEYKRVARQALTFTMYAVDEDGCPRDSLLDDHRGGWQEDAHTDKVHNIIDALTAFPEWAN
ncbi:MAG: hypothetical protein WB992_10870 [Bryobacteraceae bacterium]